MGSTAPALIIIWGMYFVVFALKKQQYVAFFGQIGGKILVFRKLSEKNGVILILA